MLSFGTNAEAWRYAGGELGVAVPVETGQRVVGRPPFQGCITRLILRLLRPSIPAPAMRRTRALSRPAHVDRCGGDPISKSEQRAEFVWEMAMGDGEAR